MPGVIALRNVLLAALLAALVFFPQLRGGFTETFGSARWFFLGYGVFLAWALAVAIFVSNDPFTGLDSARAQWLNASAALAVGAGLGHADLAGIVAGQNDALFGVGVVHVSCGPPALGCNRRCERPVSGEAISRQGPGAGPRSS